MANQPPVSKPKTPIAGKAEKMGITLVNKLRDYFDPPQRGEVQYKYYVRTGACNQCGMCCSDISLVHNEKIIETEEEFEALKVFFEDYRYFEPIGSNQYGLRFKCKNLNEDKQCTIYEDRPRFCKKYPSEDTLLMGAELAPQCGFGFKPRFSFDEVLSQTATKKRIRPGKLLNDVAPAPKPAPATPNP
ncbi:MAG: YkgJ family cysteine cluster protein [Vampirovibrionales bacterium]